MLSTPHAAEEHGWPQSWPVWHTGSFPGLVSQLCQLPSVHLPKTTLPVIHLVSELPELTPSPQILLLNNLLALASASARASLGLLHHAPHTDTPAAGQPTSPLFLCYSSCAVMCSISSSAPLCNHSMQSDLIPIEPY